jgi:hypothetical protein
MIVRMIAEGRTNPEIRAARMEVFGRSHTEGTGSVL